MSYTVLYGIRQEVAELISPTLRDLLVSFYNDRNFNHVSEMQEVVDNAYKGYNGDNADVIMQFLLLDENDEGFTPEQQKALYYLLLHYTKTPNNDKVVTVTDIRDLLKNTIKTNQVIHWY